MVRTAMLKAAMPRLVKTSDQGTADSILMELQTIEDSIIEGRTMIPVTAFQDLQEIDSKNSGQVIESMLKGYESANNIRKGNLGIPNDGAFKKNAHTLQDEQDQNQQSSDSILEDGLNCRTDSKDMANYLWGLKMDVSISSKIGWDSNLGNEDVSLDDKGVTNNEN